MEKRSFEEVLPIIDKEISKRRPRWRLKAIPSIDFFDVSQILRLHIWKKFDQWDQSRALEPWVNKIITNQLRNLMRNLYGNFSRPCLDCAANQGGDLCSIFGKQSSVCPLYAHWEKHKKSAHDTKLPLPLVGKHEQEVFNIPQETADISIDEFHSKMKLVLNPLQYKFYDLMYIQGYPEEEAARLLGYKTNEKGRKTGYKQSPILKKIILEKARKIAREDLM